MVHTTKKEILWIFGGACFWTLFLWGFWTRDVYALGLNALAYLGIASVPFLLEMRRRGAGARENLFWIVPVGLIALSFALYDNPFLKTASVFVSPILFALFYNVSFRGENAGGRWDARFLSVAAARCLGFFPEFGRSAAAHLRVTAFPTKHAATVRRVLLGLGALLAVSLLVVIPSLSAADAAFGAGAHAVAEFARGIVSVTWLGKAVFAVFLSVLTLSALRAWARPFDPEEAAGDGGRVDSIVSGILLGGILVLYLLFLGLQAGHLWTGSLPFDFRETEQLVKSGFWQLLFLSVLNIGFFLLFYRRTSRPVQHVLSAFAVASLLLLVSAAQRMGLYVLYYGLSYEKFFASYTVLFCAILLGWLVARTFASRRADIARFLAVLFLWMFALATVFPVEQFVFRANVRLARRADTQIRLYELTMFSPDVLGLVNRYRKDGTLDERVRNGEHPPDWSAWVAEQEMRIREKKWYEKNLSNLFYELGR